jgi:ferredoxin
MTNETNRHPLNVKGEFWIDRDVCLACEACIEEAPENIKMDLNETGTSYIFKQPENEIEIQQLRDAIAVCCVEAIIED